MIPVRCAAWMRLFFNSNEVVVRCSSRRARMNTSAPRETSFRASARPMPLEPPVIKTSFWSNLSMIRDPQFLHEPQEPPLQPPHPQELLELEEVDFSVPWVKQTESARL